MMAQENVTAPKKVKEIGLITNNLDNFGFSLKIGNEKGLWRLIALSASGNHSKDAFWDDREQKTNNIGIKIKIGREYKKQIVNSLYFRYGMDLGFGYSYNKEDYQFHNKHYPYQNLEKQILYQPEIKFLLGFSYFFKNNIVLGAEILPGFVYTIGTSFESTTQNQNTNTAEKDISGFNYGISNNPVMLSIGYQF